MGVPRISVLLPVHNAQAYLHEALESILAQNYGNFELLALDDGSTDGSLQILRQFQKRDSRVSVTARENRGLVASLNELLSKARGEFVARMDADDVCFPRRFERQVQFLDEKVEHIAVGGWVIHMNARGNLIGLIESPIIHEKIDAANLRGRTSIWHSTAMLRRSAIDAVGGYRSEFIHSEDLDLWLRLAETGKLANLPEPVLFYRLHEKSVSQTMGKQQRESAYLACSMAWERRNVSGTFEATDLWRPSSNQSYHRFDLQYGWTAWANGYRDTWRYYAGKAVLRKPFSLASWKLLIFGAFPSRRATEKHALRESIIKK
jgi:glycosyltransferase involved in cell wall biosynthesis